MRGITHDVFQATDRCHAPHRLPRPGAAYLRLWVPAWTESCCEQQLWGLAGELPAASARRPGAPYDPAAWQRLAAAQGQEARTAGTPPVSPAATASSATPATSAPSP